MVHFNKIVAGNPRDWLVIATMLIAYELVIFFISWDMITSTYNAYKDLVYNSTKGKYWTTWLLWLYILICQILKFYRHTDFETNVAVFETD